MSNATTFVGLDVHARSVKACAFAPETGEVRFGKSFGYEPGEIASWVPLRCPARQMRLRAGVTGFHLCREAERDGRRLRGRRRVQDAQARADRGRKTDRRDAQFLAVHAALGVVTEVHVPDAECEGARDMTRALGRRARRRRARQAAALEVPAQARARLRREERRRAEAQPLDPGALGGSHSIGSGRRPTWRRSPTASAVARGGGGEGGARGEARRGRGPQA